MATLFFNLLHIMTFLFLVRMLQAPQRSFGWSSSLLLGHQQRISISSWVSSPSISGRRRARSPIWQLQSTASENLRNQEFSTTTKVELTAEQQDLLKNWRDHPAINPTLVFPTLLVSSEALQRWIQDPQLQPYLAKPSNWNFLHHVHPRIKRVQDFNDTHKLLLLLQDENNDNVSFENNKGRSLDVLQKEAIKNASHLDFGPDLEITINFRQLSFGYILSQLLPVSAPSAYEQIGHVAHFNLKPQHSPYGELIGQVLRETNPSIDTVVSKVGEVKGDYRTYDLEVLAGPANFETTVIEHGVPIRLNVADCYWCTRLSGERQELIQDIEQSVQKTKTKDLVVADVFCGVGAVCLLLARNNPNYTILANDWNPTAIKYFGESIAKNGLDATKQVQLSCGDTYDYLIELGTDRPSDMIPDHILMNYPLEAPTFLGALRWWSAKAVSEKFKLTNRYPRFHVYTFARPSGRGRNDEEEVAVDLIANELLPLMDRSESISMNQQEEEEEDRDEVETSVAHRRRELDKDFDTQIRTRLVRDVAPGKVVVCVSFSLTPRLIRYIQGDYF